MNNQRNSHYLAQPGMQQPNRQQGFEDNFVNQSPAPYINMSQNGHPMHNGNSFQPGGGGVNINQPMSVRTDFNNPNQSLNGPHSASQQNNFRNSYVPPNGVDPMMLSPNQQQQRQMQTFYQSSPPVPAPRKTTPAQVTFADSTPASNLASIMNQSRHVQNTTPSNLEPNVPRVPDRRSPKPMLEGAKLTTTSPNVNGNMPDIIAGKQSSSAVNKAGNRTSTASSCDENLVAIPQTESVLPLGSQVWFHGAISRTESERRLKKDGDFLVREKQLAANDTKQYVLSGFQGGVVKHLLLVDPHGRVRTKNNIFESVGHLITHHMRNNIPIISSDSQVRLGNPVKKPPAIKPGMHATDI